MEGVYHGNGANANRVEEQYVYDTTNRMVKGLVYKGQSVQYEESHYIYNGFGDFVRNEWIIAKNGYGYTGVDSPPIAQVDGVVVCDRHQHTTDRDILILPETGIPPVGRPAALPLRSINIRR